VHLTVYPVRVQGEGSAEEIVKALKFFNAKKIVDVLILARGGGSMEDLWSFNEEIVARAIFASEIPVISGVGHENRFPPSVLPGPKSHPLGGLAAHRFRKQYSGHARIAVCD